MATVVSETLVTVDEFLRFPNAEGKQELDTVRAPDVAFVARERYPNGLPKEFVDGPPDIAVEVVSPSDTHAEVMVKVGEYLDAGARLVWVVSRGTRSVTVHRPDGTAHTLRGDDILSGEDVLPSFEIRVGELLSVE